MKTSKFNLLTGTYSPDQAHDLLANKMKTETQFHKLQNFTSLVRYEGNCSQASANLHNLAQARTATEALIEEAKAAGSKLYIESFIRVSLVKEAEPEPAKALCPSL